MMEITVKNCPLCGKEVSIIARTNRDNIYGMNVHISCVCGLRFIPCTVDIAEAVDLWNCRKGEV